jgi:hypothetical protein
VRLVFDPATVNDADSYDEPDRLAEGMTYILINGVLVRDGGTFSNALPVVCSVRSGGDHRAVAPRRVFTERFPDAI